MCFIKFGSFLLFLWVSFPVLFLLFLWYFHYCIFLVYLMVSHISLKRCSHFLLLFYFFPLLFKLYTLYRSITRKFTDLFFCEFQSTLDYLQGIFYFNYCANSGISTWFFLQFVLPLIIFSLWRDIVSKPCFFSMASFKLWDILIMTALRYLSVKAGLMSSF